MSYEKMMKWNKVHTKGTKQPVLMHTNSGFTPSSSFLDKYWAYRLKAEEMGLNPIECEEYYHIQYHLKWRVYQW